MTYSIRNVKQSFEPEEDGWVEYEFDIYKNGKKINSWWFDCIEPVQLYDLREALEKMKAVDLSFHCIDCKVNTSQSHEYYMVNDDIWLLANPADFGMLCISCLETRLGRLLTPNDFTSAPINHPSMNRMSDRLLDRLGYGKSEKVVVS